VPLIYSDLYAGIHSPGWINNYTSRVQIERIEREIEVKDLNNKYDDYSQARAQEKYDGNIEKGFPVKEFRKCVDYLSGVLERVEFNGEDLGDIARMAQSRRAERA
jgi:hypothetical protein